MSQNSQVTDVLSQVTEVLSQGTEPLSPNHFNASHAIPQTPHKTRVTWKNETPSSLKKQKRGLIPSSSVRPIMKYRPRIPFSKKLRYRKITKKIRLPTGLAGEYHNGILRSVYSRGKRIRTLNLTRRSPNRKHHTRRHTHTNQ